jgi:hypothetical protein
MQHTNARQLIQTRERSSVLRRRSRAQTTDMLWVTSELACWLSSLCLTSNLGLWLRRRYIFIISSTLTVDFGVNRPWLEGTVIKHLQSVFDPAFFQLSQIAEFYPLRVNVRADPADHFEFTASVQEIVQYVEYYWRSDLFLHLSDNGNTIRVISTAHLRVFHGLEKRNMVQICHEIDGDRTVTIFDSTVQRYGFCFVFGKNTHCV